MCRTTSNARVYCTRCSYEAAVFALFIYSAHILGNWLNRVEYQFIFDFPLNSFAWTQIGFDSRKMKIKRRRWERATSACCDFNVQLNNRRSFLCSIVIVVMLLMCCDAELIVHSWNRHFVGNKKKTKLMKIHLMAINSSLIRLDHMFEPFCLFHYIQCYAMY